MIWGAVFGAMIVGSLFKIQETARHKGSGIVHYGDGERSPEYLERVSEEKYKRHNYTMAGVMLILGGTGWYYIARHARGAKNLRREEST